MAETRGREAIAADYQSARAAGDRAAMRRFQNEEACFVLLAMLERLAADGSSFIHRVALKGGILMAAELRSPRTSADIDATTGHQRRLDLGKVAGDLRRAGRSFNVRLDAEPDRMPGGLLVRFRFDSLTDAGSARLEVSVREDLVFPVREVIVDVSDLGIAPFSVAALAQVELVAEKLRTLVQRGQPRDLFDLHLYLVESGWHLNRAELKRAVDAKLALTRHRGWRRELWRLNLEAIGQAWEETMAAWIDPRLLPPFVRTVDEVGRRLRDLRLE
jgi:predicted nucleotidyltransferase component of viral defense system